MTVFVARGGTGGALRRLRRQLLGLVRCRQPHLGRRAEWRRNRCAAGSDKSAEDDPASRLTQSGSAGQYFLTYSSWPGMTSTQRSIVAAILPRNCSICGVALDRDQWIVAARHDSLAEEDLDPAFLAEQLVVLAEDAAVRAPQVDLALKRRRQLHRPAIFPEIAVALVRPIVEHDEVADAFPLEIATGG